MVLPDSFLEPCPGHHLWGRNNKRVLRRNESRQGEATGSCVLLACICLQARGCCAPENVLFYFFYAECSAHVTLRICGHYKIFLRNLKDHGGKSGDGKIAIDAITSVFTALVRLKYETERMLMNIGIFKQVGCKRRKCRKYSHT